MELKLNRYTIIFNDRSSAIDKLIRELNRKRARQHVYHLLPLLTKSEMLRLLFRGSPIIIMIELADSHKYLRR